MPVITRILCPVDFSDTSAHALDQAIAIARWSGAALTALHVDHPVFAPIPGLPAPPDRVAGSHLVGVFEQTRAFIQPAIAVGLHTDVCVDVGDPVAQILDQALRIRADLIVIGTHGAGGFAHLILGSVTEKLLRKATCPVLTVPPRAYTTSALPFRRILCAVDFSAPSIDALALAASFARTLQSALDVVHVIEWPWPEPPAPDSRDLPAAQAAALLEFRRYMVAAATTRLETVTADAVAANCPLTIEVVHGKPYDGILTAAARRHADLIVLGVHGRGAADMAVFGSTTNQVVRRATCPVLTLRR